MDEAREKSASFGLELKRVFEQSHSQDSGQDIVKKSIESCLKNAAVSCYGITQDPILAVSLNEDLIQRSVINIIEFFLFGIDPVQGRLELIALNNPATICGKVFKNGEPTYSCRDCALDATCVLCMKCFGKSIHRDHNYRLNTSSGGGCCDCGDEEAWTQGASCELHSVKTDDSSDEDLLKKLPDDISARAKCLFTILLDCCVKFISEDLEADNILTDLETRFDDQKSYVALLYNDESHTFQGVISALEKAVPECTSKLGNDFATVVDQEGRCSLYVGSLQQCNEICASVKKSTNGSSGPLRCETTHIYSVACQLLGLRLMRWLSELTHESDCLRRLHAMLSTSSDHGQLSLLIKMFRADAKLWKVARLHSHQLFMNTLLKDSFGKLKLAIEFTKNYPVIMNDFYADDQDHSISAAGFSVQLFTVPSLVQMLSVNYDLMEVVITVLLDKTRTFLGDDGVLEFSGDNREKSTRLYWVIHDLRYIFQNKPTHWTENLKTKFYRFLELFLLTLRQFQGMCAIKRATGIHVEIEAEWHRGYHFETTLMGLVPFITKWCENDRDFLLKSIALTLNHLKDIRKATGATKLKNYHEGKKSMKIFNFDVSSENVSIHIPIVWFLAGLVGCCVQHSINIPEILDIKKDEDLLMYMEYPLKVSVFVAQVNAGMWKKNGFSVFQQVHAYRSTTAEMYDKDIFLMQVLASNMDKDYFLCILLDMFKLFPWTTYNYNVDKINETSLNQQLSLAAEFLHLLIIILEERYNILVGQVDSETALRREIIHRLCLGNMSRSELLRGLSLSESEFRRNGKVDDVITLVATFKKPGLSSRGMYKLKKEYLAEFNPYFYHYDKNEQSKAEDQQRKRCKEEDIPAVFKPPVCVEFLPQFTNIIELLTCKKMMEILTVILWRVKHENPKSWTDRIFCLTLHLIGLGLHEETRFRNKGLSFGFITAAQKRLHPALKYSLLQCLEALQGNPIIQAHNGLLTWTIQKFNEELSIQNDSGKKASVPENSPSIDMSHDQEKLEKQRQAKERRERVLLQMSNMQKAFIRQNSELYLSTKTDVEKVDVDQTDSAMTSSSEHVAVIAIGNDRTPPVTVPQEQFICILCQENPSSSDRPLVYSSYVQRSTILSTNHSLALEQGEKTDPLVSFRDHRIGSHVGSCGHVMHGDCWQRYFESLVANDRLSRRIRVTNTFNVDKGEFLCPLCSGLSNTVLPLVSPVVFSKNDSTSIYVSWTESFRKIESLLTQDLIDFSQSKKPATNSLLTRFLKLRRKIIPLIYGTELSNDMQTMISVFSRNSFMFGLNVQPDDQDPRVPLMVWATCAYSIQCYENNSREGSGIILNRLPKREIDVLKSLVFVANSVGSLGVSHYTVNHCIRLIAVLSGSDKVPKEQKSLMEIDMFDWMVKMRFSIPSIDCSRTDDSTKLFSADELTDISSVELDGFVFHTALVASIVQNVITTSENIPSDEMEEYDSINTVEAKEMAHLWKKLHELCSPNKQYSRHPHPQRLLLHIQYRLLPFLRCCAIFFHILNSTVVPVALKESFTSMDKEYEALAEYLSVPRNLTNLFTWSDSEKTFSDEMVTKIVARWCTNVNTENFSQSSESSILTQKTLISLPSDYSELISQASQYDCPVFSGDENRVPAKCLICGQWLCSEAWCCKQTIGGQTVGSCTAHALKCGAGVGIFLRVRDCLILLLNGIGNGCFYPSPYLDAYGETDPGLRRGNPLYLCEERYERLQKLWREHNIASEMTRYLESNKNLMQFEWMNY